MGRFVKGEVVKIPFLFTDFSQFKRRPALVVSVLSEHNDLILCMITSQNTRDRDAIPLDSVDFAYGGLPRAGNIRPNRLFTVEETRVLGSAGHLAPAKLQAVTDKLVEILHR
ncbi:MAG: growth inhibitor PemK [Chloroflexi bacterium]|nr:MAG: growth inhibitor PemK [Chloroflexota bacterium]